MWSGGDDLLLDCEAEAADDLIKRLSIYRLRRPIRIERDPVLAVHWSRDGVDGVPDPRLPELGQPLARPGGRACAPAGSSIACASPSPKAAGSSATSSGSNAMPRN